MMKKFIATMAAVMFVMLAVVPMTMASADSNGCTMYVTSTSGKGVNVRADSNTSSKVLACVNVGRPVTVTAEDMGWSAVRVKINGRTVSGYIKSEFLTKSNPASAKQTFKTVDKHFSIKTYTASKDGKVSIWNTTSKKTENKIRDIEKNEKLTVVAASRAWFKVVDANGVTGYVAKAYVTRA